MLALLRVPFDNVAPGRHELGEATARYVHRVHRRAVGAQLDLFDPSRGTHAIAKIVSIEQGRVVVEIGDVEHRDASKARETILVQCLAKGEKMDAIIRDATELGATRIAPAEAERSVVRLVKQPDRAAERSARWRRIAIEASRQCGRNEAPSIDEPASLDHVLTTLDADLKILLLPDAEISLRDVLTNVPNLSSIALVVGPEGGIAPDEITLAIEHGWITTKLGPLVLRTETVASAVLGALMVLLSSSDA